MGCYNEEKKEIKKVGKRYINYYIIYINYAINGRDKQHNVIYN